MTLTKQQRLSDTSVLILQELIDRRLALRIQGDKYEPPEVNLIRVGAIQEVSRLIRLLFDEPIITQ